MKKPLKDCACGHGREAHEHYRRGDDCGFSTCACLSFTAAPAAVTTYRLLAWHRPLPGSVRTDSVGRASGT